MTDRERRLAVYLLGVAAAAGTFLNVAGAWSKRGDADSWKRRYEDALPVAAKIALSTAEKERILAEAKARERPRKAGEADVYALGDAIGRALRASGATVKGFTIVGGTENPAVQYSAKTDSASLARFLEALERETPSIVVRAMSVGSGNEGWLELLVRAEYGTRD